MPPMAFYTCNFDPFSEFLLESFVYKKKVKFLLLSFSNLNKSNDQYLTATNLCVK